MKSKEKQETAEEIEDPYGFNFKSLKIGTSANLSDEEKKIHKDWLKYLFDSKKKGVLNRYIRCAQREFIKSARKRGTPIDMLKLLELAVYIKYLADHVSPEGEYLAIPYDELQKAFEKGPDGNLRATGYSLAKYGIAD